MILAPSFAYETGFDSMAREKATMSWRCAILLKDLLLNFLISFFVSNDFKIRIEGQCFILL